MVVVVAMVAIWLIFKGARTQLYDPEFQFDHSIVIRRQGLIVLLQSSFHRNQDAPLIDVDRERVETVMLQNFVSASLWNAFVCITSIIRCRLILQLEVRTCMRLDGRFPLHANLFLEGTIIT